MDLHGIDLNLLVAFDALMAERSVTRAGTRIGRIQPAMSAALSRLRALLGDELFVRSPSGLQPTPRALDLAEPLGRALADIQRTLDYTQAFEPGTSAATFTLGLSEHPSHVLLPQLVERLREAAPAVTLRVRSFTARDDAVAMLDTGEVDLTVGVPPNTQPGRILGRPLWEERFVCVVRREHPAAGAPLDLPAFLALSHLLVSPENERFGYVDAALAKLGRKRRLALTLPQMYAAPALVARSDLIATLMAGVVEASGRADALAVMKPPVDLEPVPFVLSWHRRNDIHPAQRWARELIERTHLVRRAEFRDDLTAIAVANEHSGALDIVEDAAGGRYIRIEAVHRHLHDADVNTLPCEFVINLAPRRTIDGDSVNQDDVLRSGEGGGG